MAQYNSGAAKSAVDLDWQCDRLAATQIAATLAVFTMRVTLMFAFWCLALVCLAALCSLRAGPACAGNRSASTVVVACIRGAVAIHAIVVIMSAYATLWVDNTISFAGLLNAKSILFIWLELAGALLALVMLNVLNIKDTLLLFIATATLAVVSIRTYAPGFYGWDLLPLGWYVPLAAAILLCALFRQRLARYARQPKDIYLQRGAIVGFLLLFLVPGMAAQCAAPLLTPTPRAADPLGKFGIALDRALDNQPDAIAFADLTNFEWNLVELYHSYTAENHLSGAARMGVALPARARFGINDGFYLAVFINNGKVVHYEPIPSAIASFRQQGAPSPIKLKCRDAIFAVSYSNGGRDFARLGHLSKR